MNKPSSACLAWVLACGLCGLCGAAAAQGYRVTDLGALDGSNSWSWAINDRGDVAGWSGTAGQYNEAFLWTAERAMRGLGTLPGRSASYGLGVNDARTVAGYSGLSFEDTGAFQWTARDGLLDLGSLGGAQTWARALNNRGQIVGESDTAGGERHVFVWQRGQMSDLGRPFGQPFATAAAISDAGHVVGNAGQPFAWHDGSFEPLPTLGGFSLAHDVNDRGQVVGSSALGDGACSTCETRAALWDQGEVVNLGMLAPPGAAFMTSVAESINNLGQVVGWSTTAPSGSHHAFLCNDRCPEGPTDLNGLVPAGWQISEAYAINDAGQIAAVGSFGTFGLLRALLLTPEQPTLVLLTPQPGRAGRDNRFELRWATPAARIRVLAGTAPGHTPFDRCATTLDIDVQRVLGSGFADAQGVAELRVPVPAALAGRPLYFQAVDLASCAKSAVMVHVFDE